MGKKKKTPQGQKSIEHGYVIVHGIGGTRDGSTVDAFVTPIVTLLRARHGDDAVSVEPSDLVPGRSATTVNAQVDGRQGRPVLVAEARWTELSAGGRRLTWVGISWTLRSFLVMLPVLLGPSAAEWRRLGHLFRADETSELSRSDQVALMPVALRGLWRLATLAVVLAAVVWCGQQLWALGPWWLIGAAAVTVAALVIALVKLPTDLAGQVRLVVEDGPARRDILSEVASAIAEMSAVCRSVTVVAHSQGGYIAHEVLQQSAPPNVRDFVALGSGLKPISLLRYFAPSGRWLPAVVSLFGVALTTVSAWMLLEPDMILGGGQLANLAEPILVLWAAPWLEPHLAPALLSEAASAANLDSYAALLGRSWPWLLASLVGAGIVIASQHAAGRFGDGAVITPLPKSVRRWHEYSTPHDVVGRLAFPDLPSTVSHVDVHGVNTFGDHLFGAYFARGSRLTATMAEDVLRRMGHQRSADALHADAAPGIEVLEGTASRWYRLRGLLQLGLVALVFVVPTVLGHGSVFGAFQSGWRWSLGIAVGTGIMALSALRNARVSSALNAERAGAGGNRVPRAERPALSVPVALVLLGAIVNDFATMLGLAVMDPGTGFAVQPMGAFVQHAFATMLVLILMVSGFHPPVWGAFLFLVPTLFWVGRVIAAPFPAPYLLPPGGLAALLMLVLQVVVAVLALAHAIRHRSPRPSSEYRKAA